MSVVNAHPYSLPPVVTAVAGDLSGEPRPLLGAQGMTGNIQHVGNLHLNQSFIALTPQGAHSYQGAVEELPAACQTIFERTLSTPPQVPAEPAIVSSSSQQVMEPPEFWSTLDLATKSALVENCLKNKNGQMQIRSAGNEIKVSWVFKGRGTAGSVYIISFGDREFAIKITSDLGASAQALLNHTIKGLVPIWAAESLPTGSVIAMDAMGAFWLDRVENVRRAEDPKQGVLFCLTSIHRLAEALTHLKSRGFTHHNLLECNVMFDKNDHAVVIDIDYLQSTKDEYAEHRMECDVRAVNHLLYNMLAFSGQDTLCVKLNAWCLDIIKGKQVLSMEGYSAALVERMQEFSDAQQT